MLFSVACCGVFDGNLHMFGLLVFVVWLIVSVCGGEVWHCVFWVERAALLLIFGLRLICGVGLFVYGVCVFICLF